MSAIKIVFTVMSLGGIAGLVALGMGDPGNVVEIGLGIGAIISTIIAVFKKK